MGRHLLVIVLLMSTIYAGIMVTLQRRMLSVPAITLRNMLEKQSEGVNDYALRTAVRNSVALGMTAGPDSVSNWKTVYNNFKVFNSTIDSIKYSFVASSYVYRARTYVTSSMGGKSARHSGEVAFYFPLIEVVGNPNVFYLRFNQPQLNHGYVIDSSPNHLNATYTGDVATSPREGAGGWKCGEFAKNKENSSGYVYHLGHPVMQVNSNFTLVCYGIIRQGYPHSTLVWIASDPYDGTTAYTDANGVYHPGQNLRLKPTAAIWYENSKMYFSATNTMNTQVTVSAPFTPAGKYPHNKDKWYIFALSYNNGVLKAYIDGLPVGTSYGGWPFPAITNTYGYVVGRRDIRYTNGLSGKYYMYMQGLLDEVGLYNRTLSDAEILGWHNQIIKPVNITYLKD